MVYARKENNTEKSYLCSVVDLGNEISYQGSILSWTELTHVQINLSAGTPHLTRNNIVDNEMTNRYGTNNCAVRHSLLVQ